MAFSGRVQSKLTELLECLSTVDELINSHVANFFMRNLWTNVLPVDIRLELESILSESDFITDYLKFLGGSKMPWAETRPNLNEFLVYSRKIGLQNDRSCLTALDKLQNIIGINNFQPELELRLKDFMSEKKRHEVEKTGMLVNALCKLTNTQLAVDIGGGKGYLSSVLSLECGLKVLSLDSSALTTCGAEKLEKKLAKRKRLAELESCRRETAFVSTQTNLNHLLGKHFGAEEAGLMGLHTCGNLATTCTKLFAAQKASWLLNVGCCYHLIDEHFDQHPFWKDFETNDYSFPVSDFLTKKEARLGRNARMLAAHSLERLIRDGFNEQATQSLFYRAVLQVIVEQARGHCEMEGQVGRLYKKCNNFNEYIRKAIGKLQLDVELSDEDIDNLTKYREQQNKLNVFTILRTHFAPLIESVILLDRLLYLYEQGITEAHLVPLFDPTLSPRSHALVAWKINRE